MMSSIHRRLDVAQTSSEYVLQQRLLRNGTHSLNPIPNPNLNPNPTQEHTHTHSDVLAPAKRSTSIRCICFP